MKHLLNIAIYNDSMYLSKHNIIDYSMFVIINPYTRKIRVGVIDYVQQYSLDKYIESTVKEFISKDKPTIIGAEPYRKRFRNAMDKYFIAMLQDREIDLQSEVISQFGADKIKWFTKD